MKFPILIFGRAGGLEYCGNIETLSTSNVLTLRSGKLLENTIVDNEGFLFIPKSVAKVKVLKISIVLNHLLRIHYEFEMPPTVISLEEVKGKVSQNVLADSNLYAEIGDITILFELLSNATTIPDLIALFGLDSSPWRYR